MTMICTEASTSVHQLFVIFSVSSRVSICYAYGMSGWRLLKLLNIIECSGLLSDVLFFLHIVGGRYIRR